MAAQRSPVTTTYRNGQVEIPFQLHRSRRRTIGISVYPGGQVRVRAPRGADQQTIMEVLRKKESWLLRKITELTPVEPRRAPVWHDGMEVPLLGQARPLRVVSAGRPGVRLTPAGFEVRLAREEGAPPEADATSGRSACNIGGNQPVTETAAIGAAATGEATGAAAIGTAHAASSAQLHRVVSRWYHHRAPTVFGHRLQVIRRHPRIAALGDPGALKVRRMRRRWGSCFIDGRINLNTELLGEPIPLIDYVIIHELCHLREHNHSPRFYRLMDEVLPDWRQRRHQLHRSAASGFLHTP